jgi:hypothetical protein
LAAVKSQRDTVSRVSRDGAKNTVIFERSV